MTSRGGKPCHAVYCLDLMLTYNPITLCPPLKRIKRVTTTVTLCMSKKQFVFYWTLNVMRADK